MVHSGEKGSPGEIKTYPGDPGQKGEKGLSGNSGPEGETDPSTVALCLIFEKKNPDYFKNSRTKTFCVFMLII